MGVYAALFILAILGWAPPAFAGAWTQPQGGHYAKLAVNYLEARSDLDADGNKLSKPRMGRLRDFSVATYIEYGILRRLTLVASAPYKRLTDERTFATGIGTERDANLGDLELRLRYGWRDAPAVFSLAGGVKLPLTYKVRSESNVPLGTGEIDADLRLLVGRSLYPVPAYLTGELGYRLRGGAFSAEWFAALEGGVSWRRLLFKGSVSSVRTLGDCGAMGQAGLIGDQNVLKFSPGLIYNLSDRVEIHGDLFHIAGGCNTTTGNTLSLGVAFKG